jgi:hypothetical protein
MALLRPLSRAHASRLGVISLISLRSARHEIGAARDRRERRTGPVSAFGAAVAALLV